MQTKMWSVPGGCRSGMAATVAACLVVFSPAMSAQDQVETEASVLVAPCFECHGMMGVSTASDVPVIAGQPAFFFIDNLLAFQREERPCRETRYRAGDVGRPATDMCRIARELSEDQIQIIAEFFAAREFDYRTQETDPALAGAGAQVHERECSRCHTGGGRNPEDDAGILAGQWMPYLRATLQDYRAGQRISLEEAMQNRMDALSETELEQLVHFYGSQGG